MKKIIVLLILGLIIYGLIFYFKPFKPLDPSVIIDKIVVTKHQRTLDLISNDQVVKTYKISLGRVPKGAKEFEGDKKTPEGSYIIDDKNPNSAYHKNLGISYPNKADIEHADSLGKSPGGLIKIHGMKNGFGWIGRFHLLRDWTLGCIAVTDQEIDELYEYVKIGTPIEIKP
ncbi:MAG TPA: L,D-transpeptidase family protein [Bacteroidales bacterium]|nr:L,D-transpeptidase family protein [Bacteroidales bacterium]HOH23435.1 L,D-transpeptidase family protein [Bacteroidales bacterium]HPB57880.1 L,D-transpeptidase family protein [Bacteroidales bacterium]HPZ02958.1 L,D-transpeptidase family protein [Bacteroidales bacterium]HQB75362.1 L,D-transpeptidase family protein [Bacteroidales bacterium]